MTSLRPYQSDAVDALRASLAQGRRAPCLVMPTGSGKTHVAAHLIRACVDKGNRAVFLAPRRELIYQTSEKLAGVDVNHGVLMAGEPRSLYPEVQVGCIPTMYRRCIADERLPLPKADLVLVDEAHLSIAKTARAIIDAYVDKGAAVIGLTATPCRSDGAGLGQIYDDLVEGPSVATLINEGHLVPARYFAGAKPDLEGVKVQAGDYNQRELGERVNRVELIGDVVENWARIARDRQSFVFAVNVSHSRALCEEFQAIGVKAEHLDGHTPNDERAEILERLRRGDTQVITNCDVLSYGVDFPPVSAVVLAKPTKSIARYFQMVGRGLRTHPRKDDCLVLDHAGAVQQIGFVDDPMPWSLEGKETVQDRIAGERSEPEPIQCGDCGAEFRPARECPNCGAEQGGTYSKAIEAHEAELREIDRQRKLADARQWTFEDKRRFYAELKAIAQRHGYKPGWVAHKYRTKTGVWPQGLKDEPPIEPSLETQAWVRSQNIRFAKRQKREARP
ncbi:DEAD/DEAH box helicase [Wenzhouxiangella sp. EGI_FJ10409]|uniref:DEAD/DEAH box helicase n=1 Tax=Wenzhouxiangella sp. EGI_FJ10409 TaxID=3243767 RepID=UPI0035D761A0